MTEPSPEIAGPGGVHGVAGPGPGEAYERRCRRLLRLAYPPRFLQTRGEEVLGTLLDLAEPGRTRPGARTVLDVLRGGAALRLRERPPLWDWVLYRLFYRRLPFRHRWWARDDIIGRFFVERLVLSWILLLLLSLLALSAFGVTVHNAQILFGWAASSYVLAWIDRRRIRRHLLAKHEFHPDGSSCVPRTDVVGDGAVPRPTS
ncbi:hypothetical protein GCM10010156_26790 [Planobispora rosea]|uniref:Uncharacterized protein n=1 Tax=Planobispora rosea TaxID=35762 RepID=A0A8J3S307_PLARO|nr:DUF5313 family protein [Planobispora rosea]GGS66569.1 hypothetical protein GCM10010156_26790 [Planobispora rosea]GIH85041.1 hypothetical protein Pro02_34490 [Planobispora rosea]